MVHLLKNCVLAVIMKRFLFSMVLSWVSCTCFSQAYISMPADSGATWRYRIYDIDYITQVFDNILFLNGQDTFAHGNTYHKILSRSCKQVGSSGFDPPVVPEVATASDTYYGAMRESGKKVYYLTIGGEELMYDFNVAIGDSIPAYSGKNKVIATDSILLSGVYHKRYLTTDPTYFAIEGVGSNRGLIPGLNDGTGAVRFYCFNYTPVFYTPDSTIPCTYVYPVGFVSAIPTVNDRLSEINVFPIPANDVLHITTGQNILQVAIFNCIGQTVWSGKVIETGEIQINKWPKGIYYIRFNGNTGNIIKKFIVE